MQYPPDMLRTRLSSRWGASARDLPLKMESTAVNRMIVLVAWLVVLNASAQAGDGPTNRSTKSSKRPVNELRSQSAATVKSQTKVSSPTPSNGDGEVRTANARTSEGDTDGTKVVKASHRVSPARARQEGLVQPEPMVMEDASMGHSPSCNCEHCGSHGGSIACDGSCDGGCDGSCGSSCGWEWDQPCDLGCCDRCFQPSRLCLCFPTGCWAQVDYLMAWQDPMRVPPLAIQANSLPELFLPGATVLLGDGNTTGRDTMLNDRRAGGRLRFGWRLSRFRNLDIQAEYFGLGTATDSFLAQSGGAPVVGVPYVDVHGFANSPDGETALAHSPIRWVAKSQLDGGGVLFRRTLCCNEGCGPSWLNCGSVPTSSRFEALLGYRYLQLRESLEGDYRGTAGQPATTFEIQDNFRTFNQFNGVDFGVQWKGRRGYWSMDGLLKMSVGNVREIVRISGSSTFSQNGVVLGGPISSGLLAAPSNIGDYSKDAFAIVPEVGANLGYQLTKRIQLRAGYTFIYWSRMVRPGQQIDRDVNPDNVPALNSGRPSLGTSPNRPQFNFVETDYWLQGLNLGAEYRW